MKKIGKRIGALVFLVSVLGFFSLPAQSQSSVSVNASISESTVYTGERVSFSVEISGNFNNVSRPVLPDFEDMGLRLLSNNPSTSRSYSFVNGESSTTYTYSYYLIGQQEGTFQIPPATITIDGEEYQTNPIEVEVIDRNKAQNSSEAEQPEIFLRLELSDSEPVAGQQLIADVVLFFKDGLEVNSYQPVPGWKAEGFWKEELENNQRPQATSTNINGVRYRKARLLQLALFPTKSGELEISPYEIVVSVRSETSRDDPFSSFFGGRGSNRRQVELESDPITLNVKPLPSNNESDYLGAVGDFTISRDISTNNTTVGESVEITTRIEGRGNIPLISKPDFELPDGLEIYEPQENTSLNRRGGAISGEKRFTDVIVARSEGNYVIPEKTVSHFDPSVNRYVKTTLPELTFYAEPNPDAVTASDIPQASPVNPITGLATWTTSPTSSSHLLTNWWFWIGILLPVIIFAVAYWQKSFIEKMNTDQAFARSHYAADKAAERLEKAISLSEQGNIKQAYNMLQKALTGFISDRLNLPEAGLSNADYVEALSKKNIDKNLVKNVRMLLDKCASISYAPDTTHAYLKSHVGLAESTLEKLKKEI